MEPDPAASASPTRAAIPTANPETSSGYNTTGGGLPSLPTSAPADTISAPPLGFGVGSVSFDFPASPSSEEEVGSHVRQTALSSPVPQPTAPASMLQPTASSSVLCPLSLVGTSDHGANNTEDAKGGQPEPTFGERRQGLRLCASMPRRWQGLHGSVVEGHGSS